MKKILPAFSYIFHPLFVSVYAALLYFLFAHQYFYSYEIILVSVQVLILTVLLPISIYYLLHSLGLVHSTMKLDKKERKIPLIIQALLLGIMLYQGFGNTTIPELYYYFAGYLISTVLAIVMILFNQKSSLHIMGVSALTVFLISLSLHFHLSLNYTIAFFILCTGFTASSRLFLKAHTPNELLQGLLIGIVPQIALWHWWL